MINSDNIKTCIKINKFSPNKNFTKNYKSSPEFNEFLTNRMNHGIKENNLILGYTSQCVIR